jgi:hypothetical protein
LSDCKDSNERTDKEEEEEDQANTPKLLSVAGLGNDKSFKLINTTTRDHNYFIDTNKNNSFDFRSKVSQICQNAEAVAPSSTVNQQHNDKRQVSSDSSLSHTLSDETDKAEDTIQSIQ